MLRWKYSRPFFLGILIFLMAIPLLPMDFFRSAGLQQTLAVALLYGALALSYDLLFGYTGLLSFGPIVTGKQRYRDWETDRKSTRLNSSHRL